MDNVTVNALLWAMALCSGLMAGTYLAFSGFIMRSLASLDTAGAVAAMNAINRVILTSSFMPLFFASTIVAAVLAGTGLWYWGEPRALWMIAAGALYVVGMFGVTGVVNVPLNNELAGVSGDGESARQVWLRYLTRWTRWNTVRSGASLITLGICIALL